MIRAFRQQTCAIRLPQDGQRGNCIDGQMLRQSWRRAELQLCETQTSHVRAQLLNVAQTKRGQMPMCGAPFHAANAYIGRLLRAGRKVAICDQIEEARPGQLVKREVTQILSPGTHFDERMLAAERNNFLACVCALGKSFGLAVADLTTGSFKAAEVENESMLLTELQRLHPTEIVIPGEAASLHALLKGAFPILNPYDDWVFAAETAQFT